MKLSSSGPGHPQVNSTSLSMRPGTCSYNCNVTIIGAQGPQVGYGYLQVELDS